MTHAIQVPWRHTINDMPDGTKQITISMNGRVSLALAYDPRTNTIAELPIADHSALETKSGVITDRVYSHG